MMKKKKMYKKGGKAKPFKPHMMYDPKSGKGFKANTMADHKRMDKMGYTHSKPKAAYGMKMKKMAMGGKNLKAVDSKKNPGLAKLPTDVRNNMGYMMMGGKVKIKKAPGGMKMGMKNKMMNYAGGGKMLNGMSMQKANKGMKMKYGMGGSYRQLD